MASTGAKNTRKQAARTDKGQTSSDAKRLMGDAQAVPQKLTTKRRGKELLTQPDGKLAKLAAEKEAKEAVQQETAHAPEPTKAAPDNAAKLVVKDGTAGTKGASKRKAKTKDSSTVDKPLAAKAGSKRQKADEGHPGRAAKVKNPKSAAAEASEQAEEGPTAHKKQVGWPKKVKTGPSKEQQEPVKETFDPIPEEKQEVRTSRAGRTVQNVNYKENGGRGSVGGTVAVKEEQQASSEAEAIKAVSEGGRAFRLLDFEVRDEAGELRRLTDINHAGQTLWASGSLYPPVGALRKEAARSVNRFGPIVGWRIEGKEASPQVVLQTPLASYTCVRAAGAYKEIFADLSEQAAIALEVQKGLDPSLGGSPSASVEEIVARMARAKVGKSFLSARQALLLNGTFVLDHLKAFDQRSSNGSSLADTAFAASLVAEVAAIAQGGGTRNGAIVIHASSEPQKGIDLRLGSAEKRSLQADEDYARQLHAKLQKEERVGGRKGGAKQAPYIKISEAEIADDYPEPAQYEKYPDETDELLLIDEEVFEYDPEDLPRRVLSDFSIYNSEGMLSTLELLPMWRGAEPDVQLFASGVVVEDEGEWAGGQSVEAAGGSAAAGGSSSAAVCSNSNLESESSAGMRIFSSQIQEWIVEFSCDLLFISIRTDAAWPAAKYARWYGVVLKSARLAVKTLTLLSEEKRASKLSFSDVLKRLAAADENDPTFVSKKVAVVERFVVVHGQILLNQFRHYHVKAVKNSAFVTTLQSCMELRRHAKLYFKPAKVLKNRANSNPMRDRASFQAKPMTATATVLVRSIWQSYFPSSAPEDQDAGEASAVAAAVEVEEDLNDEDDDVEEETALAEPEQHSNAEDSGAADLKFAWEGEPLKAEAGTTFYKSARVGEAAFSIGDVIALHAGGPADLEPLVLVQALWQTKEGEPQMQIRSVLRGSETVLGDAAAVDELFVTTKVHTRSAKAKVSKVNASCLVRNWSLSARRTNMDQDAARAARNSAAASEGRELEYIFRSLYVPEEGKFCEIPADLRLGETLPEFQEDEDDIFSWTADGKGLAKGGLEYREGDFLFLRPAVLDQLETAAPEGLAVAEYATKGGRCHKGGSNAGLRPYGIVQLISLATGGKKAKKGAATPSKVEVRRFYRPDDISPSLAHKSDFWEIFASSERLMIDTDAIVGKCKLAVGESSESDTFICTKTFHRNDGSFSAAPIDLQAAKKVARGGSKNVDKGKGIAENSKPTATAQASKSARKSTAIDDGISLASMDIFAGCGGLTEGLHQAGAAHAKWAIEYEEPAAQAFRLNHPEAVCWASNCNVILTAAMHKAGMADLCTGSAEAEEQAQKLDSETLASLPRPGEVEFLCGGPPCQGYSGMNRFNKGNWSMVQNSMVMAYLSYADFYRPRYFLLENVRNFVSHNKSFTFRLTLRSLLDMGYQVRFGVLNAGNFGVSQSRKRTFIWAAAPGELLPEWPELLHIFRSPQLTINLPGNVKYSAVPHTEGAPLRTVTVRDVISDLPPIQNGHSAEEVQYEGPPVSAFQKKVRGEETILRDHICKEMNALNTERCRCIPKNQPGADWRVLQEIVEKEPSRAKFQGQDLVPWCLPNTADRHNGWRGLFGRLDWAGHFPTSTTDPQPMGKVGQVFHPEQDRIVSVRECARAQGFPDNFRFYGNVHSKHRQIGNAVPPPLAFNLGKCLRTALERTATARQEAMIAAQMQ